MYHSAIAAALAHERQTQLIKTAARRRALRAAAVSREGRRGR